jgi:hypothetical protein
VAPPDLSRRHLRPPGRLLTAAAVVTGLLTSGLALVPEAASAATAPAVSQVAFSSLSVTLTRQHTSTVTVTFDVVASPALATDPVVVDRTPAEAALPVTATSTAGDRSNGSWSATMTFAAFMQGGHHVDVQLCPTGRDCAGKGPLVVSLGTVQVHGSKYPTLVGLRQEPRRLPAGSTGGAKAVGRVVQAGTNQPVGGVEVVLQRTRGGAGTVVDRTNRKGEFTAPWPWPQDGEGPAHLSLQQHNLPGARFDRTALTYPATRFALSTPRADKVTTVGQRLTVTGRVTPARPLTKLGPVFLEEQHGKRWVRVDKARLVSGQHGAQYTLHTRLTSVGGHTLRVFKPGALCDTKHCRIGPGHSARIGVVAGNRVFFVEQRLDRLHVPIASVDGQVDVRDLQAFCAWRDMAGVKPSRAGLTPALVSSVMSHNKLPQPNRPDGLYVSKTCQMLFQVVDHKYRRVVWASTGAPGYDTPNGTGAIFRKLRGPVESTLYPGAFMYNPMFFFPDRPAIALHGSVSNDLVEPYPASHGCVRVWRPQIWRIWQESPLGTRVKVYGRY